MLWKRKKGMLLVEAMIVTAIMGTLSAMAVPAYNKFKREAKENVYTSDIMSLHKGWQMFAVSSGSFCVNGDGVPASLDNVGMRTLLINQFYGTDVTVAGCSDSSQTTESSCTGRWDHDSNSATPNVYRIWSPTMKSNRPPNFIGFGWASSGCEAQNVIVGKASDTHVSDAIGIGANSRNAAASNTVPCSLYPDAYTIGGGGHVGGTTYVSFVFEHVGGTMYRDEFSSSPGNAHDLMDYCQ